MRLEANEPGRVGQVAVEVRVFVEGEELVVDLPVRAEFGAKAAEGSAYRLVEVMALRCPPRSRVRGVVPVQRRIEAVYQSAQAVVEVAADR